MDDTGDARMIAWIATVGVLFSMVDALGMVDSGQESSSTTRDRESVTGGSPGSDDEEAPRSIIEEQQEDGMGMYSVESDDVPEDSSEEYYPDDGGGGSDGFGGVPAASMAVVKLKRQRHDDDDAVSMRPTTKRRHHRHGTDYEQEAATAAASCTICLEDFEAGDGLAVMPCAHRFHEGCLTQWLALSHLCPCCRHALPSEDDAQPVCRHAAVRELTGTTSAAEEGGRVSCRPGRRGCVCRPGSARSTLLD